MIKIKDIMTKDVVTIGIAASIMDAARLMASKSVSSLVIVDKSKPVAVVSEDDIIRGIIGKKTKIADVISKDFTIISPSASFSDISKSMKDKKIRRYAVTENERLVGLVTETDIIQATRDFTRFHQIVQEVILAIFGLATAFFLFYFSPLRASIFG